MANKENLLFEIKLNIFYIYLGPASPIVERPSPLPGGGLNISWKSDVTSRQEEYAVRYVRNDTEEVQTIKTRTPRIKLENLYPGAGYEIKVTILFSVVFQLLGYKVIAKENASADTVINFI